MTIKPFNSVEGNSISIGDVLVYRSYSSDKLFGVKVIDYTWTTASGTEYKFWAYQYGKVQNNAFVIDDTSADGVNWSHTKALQASGYTHKWTPDVLPKFTKGDFITNKDGSVVFYYEDEDTVWKVTKSTYGQGSTYASLKTRTSEYGELKIYTTSLGTPFRKVVAGSY